MTKEEYAKISRLEERGLEIQKGEQGYWVAGNGRDGYPRKNYGFITKQQFEMLAAGYKLDEIKRW